jgi:hypothetical protein
LDAKSIPATSLLVLENTNPSYMFAKIKKVCSVVVFEKKRFETMDDNAYERP